jgi:hypothetical protein
VCCCSPGEVVSMPCGHHVVSAILVLILGRGSLPTSPLPLVRSNASKLPTGSERTSRYFAAARSCLKRATYPPTCLCCLTVLNQVHPSCLRTRYYLYARGHPIEMKTTVCPVGVTEATKSLVGPIRFRRNVGLPAEPILPDYIRS